jgi:OOP family OmpA-OmpF porin
VFKRSRIIALILGTSAAAHADEPPRVHFGAGAAHAVGGPQQDELGPGGGGSATLEFPLQRWIGVQAGVGGVVLSKGDPNPDRSIASRSTGAAILGTAGVRVHPLPVAGPWVDANVGGAETGGLFRPTLDAHIGWDFRVSSTDRWDVGPFLGFTQIVQPNSALRPDDGRILWAGVAVSLGARSAAPPALPPAVEPAPPPPVVSVVPVEEPPVATAECPEGTTREGDDCVPVVTMVDDRIVLGDVIHFQFNSGRIRSESIPLVRRVATFIAEHPEIVVVHIEGHADAVGTEDYNQRLSEERAASTRAVLIESGADESRLVVAGHGKSQLKVATPRPEARNRRVEFIVERKSNVKSRVDGGGS